jgi:flagellar hook protein FlgE
MGAPIAPAISGPTTGNPQILQVDAATLPTDQGTLESLSVGSNGDLQGTFSGGNTVGIAKIPLSTFNGQEFFQQGDGGTFIPTPQSGTVQLDASGKIVGSALEASDTDIDNQFTALIMTQQAYGANTKLLTASIEMLQTLTNMTL